MEHGQRLHLTSLSVHEGTLLHLLGSFGAPWWPCRPLVGHLWVLVVPLKPNWMPKCGSGANLPPLLLGFVILPHPFPPGHIAVAPGGGGSKGGKPVGFAHRLITPSGGRRIVVEFRRRPETKQFMTKKKQQEWICNQFAREGSVAWVGSNWYILNIKIHKDYMACK